MQWYAELLDGVVAMEVQWNCQQMMIANPAFTQKSLKLPMVLAKSGGAIFITMCKVLNALCLLASFFSL